MTAATMRFSVADTHQLASEAKTRADAAHTALESHEELCDLRQGQLRTDIAGLKDTVFHATLWLLGGMVALIVTLLGTLIGLVVHGGHV